MEFIMKCFKLSKERNSVVSCNSSVRWDEALVNYQMFGKQNFFQFTKHVSRKNVPTISEFFFSVHLEKYKKKVSRNNAVNYSNQIEEGAL